VAPLNGVSLEDDKQVMGRLVRNGLFPLVVVVLLVYLASQTLLPGHAAAVRVEYGDFLARVDSAPQAVRKVTFNRDSQVVEAEFRDETKIKAKYTTDASAFALEQRLRRAGVRIDSASKTEWWSVLTYLLPFVLFFLFWILLMSRKQRDERPPGIDSEG
jgi:cell division protease FtsH